MLTALFYLHEILTCLYYISLLFSMQYVCFVFFLMFKHIVDNCQSTHFFSIFQVFNANTDADSKATNWFEHPLRAQYIRIVPQSWNGVIAMRLEILGCYEGYKGRKSSVFAVTTGSLCIYFQPFATYVLAYDICCNIAIQKKKYNYGNNFFFLQNCLYFVLNMAVFWQTTVGSALLVLSTSSALSVCKNFNVTHNRISFGVKRHFSLFFIFLQKFAF